MLDPGGVAGRFTEGGDSMTCSRVGAVVAAVCWLGVRLAAQPDVPLDIFAVTESDGVRAGTTVRVAIHLRMPQGLHIVGPEPTDPYLIPITVSLATTPGVRLSGFAFPTTPRLSQPREPRPLPVLPEDAVVGARLAVASDVSLQRLALPISVRYQACDAQRCYIPARVESVLELRAVSASTPLRRQSQDLFQRLDASISRSPAEPTHSIRDGIYTDDQAKRGSALYASYCASCHAMDLQGFTPTPLSGAPALVGSRFIANWTNMTVGHLFYRVRVSMPQERPGSLSRQQVADILAFLVQQNGYPAAEVEQPTTEELLTEIAIDPPTP